MGVTSELTKENVKKKDTDIDFQESDINVLIESASRVIAPLWPISTFAARNPWMGLEKQSFDQVADWLKNTRDVDIYPSASMILSAKSKGEIDEAFVKMGLQRWLDSHSFNIPRDVAERFCHTALKLDPLPSNLLSLHKLEKLGEEFSGLNTDNIENFPMQPISSHIENKDGKRLVNILDHHVIKWCKLYLDDSQAGWTMPNREEGFYRAWQRLIQYDPALSKKQRESLKGWPQEVHMALKEALFVLEIPESEIQAYLEGHLLSLPGWAGMMLWRSRQSSHEHALLTEYLAVRISMELALIKPYLPLTNQRSEKRVSITPLIASWIHWGDLTIEEWSQMSVAEQNEYLSFAYSFDEKLRRKLWLEAWEQTYTDRLSQKIFSKQRKTNDKKSTLAQLAFCIDVRSEPFRRQLEKEGPFETIGIAGFFGLPIATSELGSNHSHSSLPVILKPRHKIKESANENELKSYQQRKQAVNSLSYTFKMMKQNVLSSLLLPELSGPWLSLQMVARSFVPRGADRFIRNLRETWLRKPNITLSLNHVHNTEAEIPVGFSEEERVNYARQALKMMGLTKNFAPLVVICGHGSQSTNNPYAAALDCGACGGAAGGFNARVLAALCNLPEVRGKLSSEGFKIPEDTVFVAAEHKTTVDELRWIYVPELSEAAQEAFDRIEAIMPKVSHNANAERLAQLPNFQKELKKPKAEAHRFAEDWSEIRPEWGLARNAAFIIGQRELTQDCDLEGRAFLHNYDWNQDESGDLLANIIAGPGTVAQWINLQYYASTVAPHYYGSGNKATQTVTAGLGVMQGNASDLLAGLPWQSVMQSDYETYHSPLRLLIVIQAPSEYVERLLNNDSAFRKKVQNGWVRLASVDPEGRWENWELQK
ncbi:DUF2309 domain-containing protein [Aneurinibacillus migulanus]|uniref:Probable inorganic carbon transporter subunit DabA n=1 Tax=Aneurinibacillus migulanus TaxID=47500 RepID=A0A0D1V3Z2_ANEMI|nr:putative inorganic carbon transporter subunit DabA [Aneurinibacillus migulanus]KIV54069.1 hypothetical protein TS65_19120 [Aneurinibacillus migulanus]KON97662.1 hypothetical protein AF333_21680 [Aneurinibacillus migulanus]MED0894418.1 Na-translocating system protein MpsB [Aneurinibacillus migulanus]MED1617028.1 Na-translocating system protein MpsB [Aneurinibacillus migulanus]SDJ35905.1 hypothetical protein SAMN04487909_11666 [Aneurinibacillus migulanus]